MNPCHSSKRALAVFMLAAVMIASAAGAANLPLPTAEATSSITTRDLRMHLSFLASEDKEGLVSYFSYSRKV